MSQHLDRLEAARRALLSAEPAVCAAEITAFELLCADSPPPADSLPECQRQLHTLALMAQACMDGAAAASRQLQDALAAAGQLTTYDPSGGRKTRATRTAAPRRF